jgi:cell filamentation protein
MSFDPFGDFETRGYLRNMFGEKDPGIMKHLEHSAFIAGVSDAFKHLQSVRRPSYDDVLKTHRILFGDIYPWAGQDRMQTAPEIAVSKGPVLFAHPRDARAAVEYGLRLGSEPKTMTARPGEVMGYLAFGHPFLDGNGRTIMVVHAALAERAGFSLDWTATSKSGYLGALTKEIAQPNAKHLDAYLKPFLRPAIGIDKLAEHLVNTRGLDGSSMEDNRVLGNISDPVIQAQYAAQRLQRQDRSRDYERDDER